MCDQFDELRWLRLDIGQISVADETRDFMTFYRENVVRANSKNIDVSLKWENKVRDVIFSFIRVRFDFSFWARHDAHRTPP